MALTLQLKSPSISEAVNAKGRVLRSTSLGESGLLRAIECHLASALNPVVRLTRSLTIKSYTIHACNAARRTSECPILTIPGQLSRAIRFALGMQNRRSIRFQARADDFLSKLFEIDAVQRRRYQILIDTLGAAHGFRRHLLTHFAGEQDFGSFAF